MKTKVCTKCGIEKPLEEFYNDKKIKDGKTSRCKECTKEKVKEFRDSERGKQYKKQYEQKEKYKEWRKQYRQKPERKAKQKEYNKSDRRKQAKLKYRKTERYKNWQKQYQESDKFREKSRLLSKTKKYKEYCKKRARKQRDIISNEYVKQVFVTCGFKREFITQELVELKRVQIQIHRELKKMDQL